MLDDPRIQSLVMQLQRQLNSLLLVLERPVVQRQLLALVVVAGLAWLLPRLLRRLFGLLFGRGGFRSFILHRLQGPRQERWRRIVRALDHMYFPVLGILLSQIAIRVFLANGWWYGLLQQAMSIFGLLLLYRLVVALLYALFQEATARPYHRRVLIPLFAFVVFWLLEDTWADPSGLTNIALVTIAGTTITLGSILSAFLVLYFFAIFAWVLQDILRVVVFPRTDASPGTVHTVLTVTRYSVLAAGLLAAISAVGFNLSSLAIIGGGLSVGIGFGLQDLVANFISGLLIMFEQTLRPGDIVEVEGKVGIVDNLRIRSTMIRTLDNAEIIVPNKTLLTSTVTTLTHKDRRVRLSLTVGVSYDSDPKEVREILLEVAERHGLVLNHPPPAVFFSNFGESSLDFELAVWIDGPERTRPVLSDLRFMIWDALEKRGIEIPYPQRDLHLRSGWLWDGTQVKESQDMQENGHGEAG